MKNGNGIRKKFLEISRNNGWRATVQRQTVFGIMNGNRSHPPVDLVWREARKKVPSISVDSVYRILDDFCGAGIFLKLDHYDKVRYDGASDPHGHFFCVRCGNVFDLPLRRGLEFEEDPSSFGTVLHEDVRIAGICNECRTDKSINKKTRRSAVKQTPPKQGE